MRWDCWSRGCWRCATCSTPNLLPGSDRLPGGPKESAGPAGVSLLERYADQLGELADAGEGRLTMSAGESVSRRRVILIDPTGDRDPAAGRANPTDGRVYGCARRRRRGGRDPRAGGAPRAAEEIGLQAGTCALPARSGSAIATTSRGTAWRVSQTEFFFAGGSPQESTRRTSCRWRRGTALLRWRALG
jgi:hypothetical protein